MEENVWLPSEAHLRPHRWFRARPDRGDEIRLNNGSIDGEELVPFGWMVHRHNAKTGFTGQSGLYRVLVWPYLFKNFSLRDMAEFLEIYGLPARVGTYMAGPPMQTKTRSLTVWCSLAITLPALFRWAPLLISRLPPPVSRIHSWYD